MSICCWHLFGLPRDDGTVLRERFLYSVSFWMVEVMFPRWQILMGALVPKLTKFAKRSQFPKVRTNLSSVPTPTLTGHSSPEIESLGGV